MVYFEGIGLVNEKPPIVLEIGHLYTKCGVAGDTFPYGIVPTPPHLFKEEAKFHGARRDGTLQLEILNFLQEIVCAQTLLISFKDRQILIVEFILGSSDFREALGEVLFNHFEAAALLFASSHSVTLYPLGISTGLVVDIGSLDTSVAPVCDRLLLLNAVSCIPRATSHIHQAIKAELAQCKVLSNTQVPVPEPDFKVLEDIQVRCCFVTTQERLAALQEGGVVPKTPPPIDYPLDGAHTILLPGKMREFVAEALFELDGDECSITSTILDTIVGSPVDTRRELVRNVVVTGGTACMPGLIPRLHQELWAGMDPETGSHKSLSGLQGDLRIHEPGPPANYFSWLGGSIMGATSVVHQRAVTREQYKRMGRIPEWCDNRDNPRTPSGLIEIGNKG